MMMCVAQRPRGKPPVRLCTAASHTWHKREGRCGDLRGMLQLVHGCVAPVADCKGSPHPAAGGVEAVQSAGWSGRLSARTVEEKPPALQHAPPGVPRTRQLVPALKTSCIGSSRHKPGRSLALDATAASTRIAGVARCHTACPGQGCAPRGESRPLRAHTRRVPSRLDDLWLAGRGGPQQVHAEAAAALLAVLAVRGRNNAGRVAVVQDAWRGAHICNDALSLLPSLGGAQNQRLGRLGPCFGGASFRVGPCGVKHAEAAQCPGCCRAQQLEHDEEQHAQAVDACHGAGHSPRNGHGGVGEAPRGRVPVWRQ